MLPYQLTLARALLLLPYTAKITQCRQSGKSFILGLVSYFLAYAKGWDIVITAPRLEQTWHIMRHTHRAQGRIGAKTLFDNKYSISLRGRGSVTCLSGSETAHVEGSSAHVVIIDEHQDLMAEYIAEAFLPMLSWTEGLLWSCGIGGGPGSVAERRDVDFSWVLPWERVVEVKPGYRRLVDVARREQLPEQFAAHYGCLPLDISSKLLVPTIQPYDTAWGKAKTTVGIDWGKRIDSSVATVVDRVGDRAYITGWLVPTGSYDEQVSQLARWLKNDVDYDAIVSEANGVGDGNTDFLLKAMKDPRGFDSGAQGFDVDREWITTQAKLVHRMAGDGALRYNPQHDLAGPFVKEITQVEYRMLDSHHIKLPSSGERGHSDFLSSLMLALHEPGAAYL